MESMETMENEECIFLKEETLPAITLTDYDIKELSFIILNRKKQIVNTNFNDDSDDPDINTFMTQLQKLTLELFLLERLEKKIFRTYPQAMQGRLKGAFS